MAASDNALTVAEKDLLSEWSHPGLLAPRENPLSTHTGMGGIISIYRGHKGLGFLQRVGNKIV